MEVLIGGGATVVALPFYCLPKFGFIGRVPRNYFEIKIC